MTGKTAPHCMATGTEDYFNTSWGAPDKPYSTPYFGYAKINGEKGFLGRTHIYRFHMQDPIYFDTSFRFTIEHGSMNVMTLDLASVAYWYQSTASRIPAIPDAAARKPRPAHRAGGYTPLEERVAEKQRERPHVMGKLIIQVNQASGQIKSNQ